MFELEILHKRTLHKNRTWKFLIKKSLLSNIYKIFVY